jgi:homoserine kinase
MTLRALAPASTANLGPGFDAAAAALDLWNEAVVEEIDGGPVVEIEGEGAGELTADAEHLTIRAFALVAAPDRFRFRLLNRIPLERGLGSSAAAIAIGLVAGAAVSDRELSAPDLLALGEQLEGHADNLAAALLGGVSITWRHRGERRVAKIASDLPLTPVIAVPPHRTNTAYSRNGLPSSVSHEDAVVNAAHAALLGAAIASGDASLLAAAFSDRLHEQYRADGAPLLRALRDRPPVGAAGVTLSGSGPSVVVWAEPGQAGAVARELESTLPADTTVLALGVSPQGARAE